MDDRRGMRENSGTSLVLVGPLQLGLPSSAALTRSLLEAWSLRSLLRRSKVTALRFESRGGAKSHSVTFESHTVTLQKSHNVKVTVWLFEGGGGAKSHNVIQK